MSTIRKAEESGLFTDSHGFYIVYVTDGDPAFRISD